MTEAMYEVPGSRLRELSDDIKRLKTENDLLRDLAELAVLSCLPLLPLRGSSGNYEVEPVIHQTLRATPEEWAEAAYCVAALDKAITSAPPPRKLVSESADHSLTNKRKEQD